LVGRDGVSRPMFEAENPSFQSKVFIDDLALEALKRLKAVGGGPNDFVFRTCNGTPFNPSNGADHRLRGAAPWHRENKRQAIRRRPLLRH
jgi:hypothetical protein